MRESVSSLYCELLKGSGLKLVLMDELGVSLEDEQTLNQILRDVLDSVGLELSHHYVVIGFITDTITLAFSSTLVTLQF